MRCAAPDPDPVARPLPPADMRQLAADSLELFSAALPAHLARRFPVLLALPVWGSIIGEPCALVTAGSVCWLLASLPPIPRPPASLLPLLPLSPTTGMFELNNLSIYVGSPVQRWLQHLEGLPEGEQAAAFEAAGAGRQMVGVQPCGIGALQAAAQPVELITAPVLLHCRPLCGRAPGRAARLRW